MRKLKNVTITLEDDVARWARMEAARENTSVSRFVGELLADRMRQNQEYEAAMERAFGEAPFGYERVDEFAWTEIDFEEDVVKARKLARGA